jgi:hypothetical protein
MIATKLNLQSFRRVVQTEKSAEKLNVVHGLTVLVQVRHSLGRPERDPPPERPGQRRLPVP